MAHGTRYEHVIARLRSLVELPMVSAAELQTRRRHEMPIAAPATRAEALRRLGLRSVRASPCRGQPTRHPGPPRFSVLQQACFYTARRVAGSHSSRASSQLSVTRTSSPCAHQTWRPSTCEALIRARWLHANLG